jgi:hypothetical protein
VQFFDQFCEKVDGKLQIQERYLPLWIGFSIFSSLLISILIFIVPSLLDDFGIFAIGPFQWGGLYTFLLGAIFSLFFVNIANTRLKLIRNKGLFKKRALFFGISIIVFQSLLKVSTHDINIQNPWLEYFAFGLFILGAGSTLILVTKPLALRRQ